MGRGKDSLLNLLQAYYDSDVVPMHMPGHKRNAALAPYLGALGAKWDITEVAGFDDLHHAEGVLREAMNRASRLWHSRRTFFLVGGSSCGILAGVRAAAKRGDKVLIARNCHKAVYHALELCGLDPVFLTPPMVPGYSFFASLPPYAVADALSANPEIRLIVLTSPTYPGVLSDVGEICRIAHERGVPVLVDEAHGAHLGFHPSFRGEALAAGADVVIQSLHKTLPSLTQTALAHLSGELVSPEEMARQLGIFQSSSPSYLLMASIDGCVRLLEEQGDSLFEAWDRRLKDFDRAISGLTRLRVFGHGKEHGRHIPEVFGYDPSKIVISTWNSILTGPELSRQLRTRYHIEMEMELEDSAVAMTGMGGTPIMLERLADALRELDAEFGPAEEKLKETLYYQSYERRTALDEAVQSAWERVPLDESAGRVCGEYLWAYPPGIPLIIPGEKVEESLIVQLCRMGQQGVNLIGTRAEPPATIAVLRSSGGTRNKD